MWAFFHLTSSIGKSITPFLEMPQEGKPCCFYN